MTACILLEKITIDALCVPRVEASRADRQKQKRQGNSIQFMELIKKNMGYRPCLPVLCTSMMRQHSTVIYCNIHALG